MSRIELFTPWREDVTALRRRTVGRQRLGNRLEAGVAALRKGRPAPALYLYGPRGVGKSHLLALHYPAFEQAGLGLVVIHEDIPAIASADTLLRLAHETDIRPQWMRLGAPSPEVRAYDRPTILVIEGLDRRLQELGGGAAGREERQKLRAAWDHNPLVWVVATGVELLTPLSDSSEPFFGWFDPEPVEPLTPEESRELIERLVPDTVRTAPHWAARREALVPLAGGSPRVLVTLAERCASPAAAAAASEALLGAVDPFTAHYQMRFRDLAPLGQRIVSILAAWPRELAPSEIAGYITESRETTIGTTCRRLADDGVLERREERGGSRYRIAEPLFRYWLEYSASPWERTRVALATSLLQALLSRQDLGIVDPARLDDLQALLPEEWAGRGHEAGTLVAQLRDIGHGQLHPELAALRALLTPRETTAGA